MVKALSPEWLDKVYRAEYVPCHVIHDHSCEWNAIRKFMLVFNMAYKFYIPIHLLPTLIFKRSRITKEPMRIVKYVVKNVIQSSCFISCYVAIFWYFCCVFRNQRLKTDKWNVIGAAFLCSFSILFEPSNRRTELALYMFPRFVESMMLFFEKRGYFMTVSNGEVGAFAVSLGVIMYCF